MVSRTTTIRRVLESPGALRSQFLSRGFLLANIPHLCTSINYTSVKRHLHWKGIEKNDTIITTTRATTTKAGKECRSIDAFGIVAAVCTPNSPARSEGIIGVNGKLPWGSLPSDREIFERLTRDRVIVLGRKTLLNERDGDLDHVRHAKHCIVVSESISSLGSDPRLIRPHNDLGFLKLARSLEEALDLARELATESDNQIRDGKIQQEGDNEMNGIDSENPPLSSNNHIRCWVAGGERLYEEALQHRSALELHLSVIDMEIDLTASDFAHVAMFPARHRWLQNYDLASTTSFSGAGAESNDTGKPSQDENPEPSFDYRIYKRIF